MRKSWWHRLDFVLILLVLALVCFGFLMIASANYQDVEAQGELYRQIFYFFVGIVFMIIFASIDHELLAGFERYFYIVTILLLLLVLFFGRTALGATRWIKVGFFSFQPSEFAKIFLIISLAHHLSKENALKADSLATLFLYIGIPMVLIILQPDLGTSLVLVAVLFVMLYVRGFSPWYILGFSALGLAVSPFVLREYQKKRLLIFLNPQSDPTGAGWNIIQSMISIGSGRLWGKGLFSGTQIQLRFVPEHSTDFIFAVIGEELGFIGGVGIIVLFGFFLWRIISIAKRCHDLTGTLMAVGIAAMFLFHIFVNIGMTCGIMPVTGIPLPFISYGGSSLITNMIAVGILLNISKGKDLFFKQEK